MSDKHQKELLISLLRKSAEHARSVDEAADYLISNGVMVLPVKVGQIVYWNTGLEIREYRVQGLFIDSHNNLRLDLDDFQPIYPSPNHIYLSRDEYEAEVKGAK